MFVCVRIQIYSRLYLRVHNLIRAGASFNKYNYIYTYYLFYLGFMYMCHSYTLSLIS